MPVRAAAAAPPRTSLPPGPRDQSPVSQHPRAAAPARPPATAEPSGRPIAPAPEPVGQPAATVQPGEAHPLNGDRAAQCTAPQLRRFIKSRPYVPMHELRRRFSINGDDDEVTPVRIDPGWIFVGLPTHEGHLLGDLLRTGEIGYELSLDPRTPIVIGVYPMRPIPRN